MFLAEVRRVPPSTGLSSGEATRTPLDGQVESRRRSKMAGSRAFLVRFESPSRARPSLRRADASDRGGSRASRAALPGSRTDEPLVTGTHSFPAHGIARAVARGGLLRRR